MKRDQAEALAALMPKPPDDWPFEVRLKTLWSGEDCVAFKAWVDGEEPEVWTRLIPKENTA